MAFSVRRGRALYAEIALERAFARDASREVAFDRLFRRVRGRGDPDKLLTYDQVNEAADSAIEHRLDGASVNLETETGKPVKGNLSTN